MQSAPTLPAYTVRKSSRAKRATIRILPGRGVEVVLPPGISQDFAAEFVRAKAAWIQRALRRMSLDAPEVSLLPGKITLQAISRAYGVRYATGVNPPLRLRENAETLQFLGATTQEHERQHCALLQYWLKSKAREHLVPWVRRLETECGLCCGAVQVRLQRTRWGSCSGRKTLSLNAALLFLPPDQTRYVLLHELCHTRHLNHSPQFWELLCRVEPAARALDRALNQGWSHVPAWAMTE